MNDARVYSLTELERLAENLAVVDRQRWFPAVLAAAIHYASRAEESHIRRRAVLDAMIAEHPTVSDRELARMTRSSPALVRRRRAALQVAVESAPAAEST